MHKTVLLGEAVEILKIEEGDTIVDATLGAGGHALEIAQKVGAKGKVIAIDVDQDAIEIFKTKIEREHTELKDRFQFVQGNFADLNQHLETLGVEKVDGILADLGWRIEQMEEEKYGMSFLKESKLDMRLDQGKDHESAHEIVNNWSEKQLQEIFLKFGEEKNSKRIAREILIQRQRKSIDTTSELADLVLGIFGRRGKIHPATRIFQALRIQVNNEFENIEKLLAFSTKQINSGGRIAMISFHSLEDRIVKKFFQANAGGCVCPKEFPICVCGHKAILKIVTKKPIVPNPKETETNPRSRSAKLRVAEVI